MGNKIRIWVLYLVITAISLPVTAPATVYRPLSAISLEPTTPTNQSIAYGETAEYNLTLTNDQDVDDDFDVMFDASSLPEDWRVQLCVAGLCYVGTAPCVLTGTMSLRSSLSGEINIHVTVPEVWSGGGHHQTGLIVTSQSNPDISATANLTTTLPVYDIALSCDESSQSAAPGNVAAYSIIVANNGNVEDTVLLDAEAIPASWALALNESSVALVAGDRAIIGLSATVPIDALANEQCQIMITGASQSDPNITDNVTVTATVLPMYGISMACESANKMVAPGNTIEYHITVTNHGNIDDIVHLNISSTTHIWELALSTYAINLSAGSSTEVTLSVTAPATAQDDEHLQITITGRLQGGDVPLSAHCTVICTVKIGAYYDVALYTMQNSTVAFRNYTVSYWLTVTNIGNTADGIDLALTGTHVEWYSMNTTFVELNASAAIEVLVMAHFPQDAPLAEYTVTVTVVSIGDYNKSDTVTLTTSLVNRPPVISALEPMSVYEAEQFTLQIDALDPDGDALTFADNAALFDVNSNTGLIAFTPGYDDAGSYCINISASDGLDVAQVQFELTVINVNRRPTAVLLSPSSDAKYETSDEIYFDATGSVDPDNDTLAYMWVSSVDGHIGSIRAFSRRLSAGMHTITLTVTDGTADDTKQVQITVAKPAKRNDKNFIPGFGIATLLATLGVVGLLFFHRKIE